MSEFASSFSGKTARAGWGSLLALAVTFTGPRLLAAEERARLIPPRVGPDTNTLGVEADGTRRLVVSGLRALAHPSGSTEVSSELLPAAKTAQVLELPPRFGAGFLFYVTSSGRTSLWKASTFTGRLAAFTELDFELERLVLGFDRLYAQARRTGEWMALDMTTGVGIDRGSLPRSPSFGAMAFADAWFGAVELPIRGLVASFDAGQSWHGLGAGFSLLGVDNGEILINAPDGRRRLGPDGSLRPADAGAVRAASDGGAARKVIPEGPLGSAPLTSVVLRGFPLDATSAVVAAGGALSRVRLSDGEVLATRRGAVPIASDCSALPLGGGQGFLCREAEGSARLYAFEPPLGVRLVEAYAAPRRIVASGNGGLVLRGGCGTGAAEGGRAAVTCVRRPNGTSFEIATPSGEERVIALRDGRAAKLVPPTQGSRGSLVLVTAGGAERILPLSLRGRDEAARALFERGFWLDAMVEGKEKQLSGWISGRGAFAGVSVDLDGHVRIGSIRRGIERAMLVGERALVILSPAVAEQSVDGGATFTDVDLPPELDIDTAKLGRLPSPLEQGCSALGCAFAGWVRVGWDGLDGSKPLPVAPAPRATRPPPPGGGRWVLRCAASGESSPPAMPTAPPPSLSEGEAPWLGLFERPPPARSRDVVTYDVRGSGDMRAYAWGPRGADFSRAGRLQVAVLDPFRIRSGVWASLPTPSPWADNAQLVETFGFERSTSSAWNITLDPSGRAGVLSVAVRGNTELYAVEENRAVLPLVNATRQGVGSVLGAVRLGATYYVMAQDEPHNLRLFALESGQARLIGQYVDLAQGGRGSSPTLVRSVRGDALAIWTRSAGWFVFPVDATSGAVGAAIEISAADLSRVPRSCAPDEEGYLLEGPIGLDPYAEFAGDSADKRTLARLFEGRFVVSEHGICVNALTAHAERNVVRPATPKANERSPNGRVPLVLRDPAEGGRRWGFRCGE